MAMHVDIEGQTTLIYTFHRVDRKTYFHRAEIARELGAIYSEGSVNGEKRIWIEGVGAIEAAKRAGMYPVKIEGTDQAIASEESLERTDVITPCDCDLSITDARVAAEERGRRERFPQVVEAVEARVRAEEVEPLRTALRRYGDHLSGCIVQRSPSGRCDCGYVVAIDGDRNAD